MAGGHRMVARRATDAARRAAQSEQSKAAHRASLAGKLPREEKIPIPKAEHGKRIYVFNHLQTNQVVYSLKAAMENSQSLKQLPYNGKKTVPSALRKDLWHPLCQITFPPSPPVIPPPKPVSNRRRKNPKPIIVQKNINTLGLAAFQKLREYRRRHELEWEVEDFKDEEGNTLGRKARGRKLCDQKANAVADLAAVLEEVTSVEGAVVAEDAAVAEVPKEGETEAPKEKHPVVDESTQIIVKWSDLLDAEYAETWSPNVVHDVLEYTKNNRDPSRYNQQPAPEDIVEEPTVERTEAPAATVA